MVSTQHKSQEINPDSFAGFLALLAPTPEQAGEEYEVLRKMLIKFFECRGQAFADDLTDKVFNRVIRRLSEGEQIDNLSGYCYSVARFILMEQARSPERRQSSVEDLPPIFSPENTEDERLDFLHNCLNALPPENRALILEYYQDEKRSKINIRQQMAVRLGVSRNALASRMLRFRDQIEKCVMRRLKKNSISTTQIQKP